MRPVCGDCRIFMTKVKEGFHFTECRWNDEQWVPSAVHRGNLWSCRECDATVILDVGNFPVTHEGHRDFEERRVALDAKFNVEDH